MDSSPLSIENSARQIRDFLNAPHSCVPKDGGRGIVIAGGGGRWKACTYVCISRLRELGCVLPIEVWYLGEEERDEFLFDEMRTQDVTFVDAHEVKRVHAHAHLGGWELKPYSILHSRFEHVLFLDADNSPVVDPTFLFDAPEYQSCGALFWPDFWRTGQQSLYWYVMDIHFRDAPEFESGQIVVNTTQCAPALRLANWLCERGTSFYWKYCHGDKDCFRAAWWRVEMPFCMPSYPVIAVDDKAMLQHDFNGRPLFQHRQMAKWNLAGNQAVHGFLFEDACLHAVARLRRSLLGHRFSLSKNDWKQTDALVGSSFMYRRCGYDERHMELDKDCEVGNGRAALEEMYFVKNNQLYLVDLELNVTCFLDPANGNWEGRWRRFEKMPIVLEAIA